jgi:hypothetical protein
MALRRGLTFGERFFDKIENCAFPASPGPVEQNDEGRRGLRSAKGANSLSQSIGERSATKSILLSRRFGQVAYCCGASAKRRTKQLSQFAACFGGEALLD